MPAALSSSPTHRSRRHVAALIRLLAVVVVAMALVGCDIARTTASPAASPSPSPSPAASVASSPATGPSVAPSKPAGSLPTQTDTDWGRIWDAVPASVPIKPGAEPSEFGDSEPYSGTYAVPATVQQTIDWEQLALRQQGWAIATQDGPNEDGSVTIELGSRKVAECMVQLVIGPQGSLTAMRIRVSSTCPFT